jgi:hypothetical protein
MRFVLCRSFYRGREMMETAWKQSVEGKKRFLWLFVRLRLSLFVSLSAAARSSRPERAAENKKKEGRRRHGREGDG